jgi:O-antigen ligase
VTTTLTAQRPAGWRRGGRAASRAVPGAAGQVRSLDLFRIGLFVLTVVAVSKAHIHFPVVAALRPATLGVAAAALALVLRPSAADFSNLSRSWQARVLIAFVLLGLVGAPFGLSLGASAQYFLDSYSKMVIHALLLFVVVRAVRDVWLLVWAYVWSCALMIYLAIFVLEAEQIGSQVMRIHGMGAYDSNDFGCIAIAGVPLTLVTFHTARWPGKIASALILVGIGVSFAKSGSRGGFLGLLAVGLAILLTLRIVPVVKRALLAAVVALALVLSAPQGYWEQMSTMLDIEEDYNWSSVDGRKQIAERGIGYMLQYPVFGVGMSNFGRAEITISDKARATAPGEGIFMAAPHNTYVQVGAELGVPSLLLWCSLIFGSMYSLRRLRKRVPQAWRTGTREETFLFYLLHYLPLSFLGFAVTSMFVSFAYLEPLYVLVAIAGGVTLVVRRRLADPASGGPVPAALRPAGRGRRQRFGAAGSMPPFGAAPR